MTEELWYHAESNRFSILFCDDFGVSKVWRCFEYYDEDDFNDYPTAGGALYTLVHLGWERIGEI